MGSVVETIRNLCTSRVNIYYDYEYRLARTTLYLA